MPKLGPWTEEQTAVLAAWKARFRVDLRPLPWDQKALINAFNYMTPSDAIWCVENLDKDPTFQFRLKLGHVPPLADIFKEANLARLVVLLAQRETTRKRSVVGSVTTPDGRMKVVYDDGTEEEHQGEPFAMAQFLSKEEAQ